MPTLSPVVLSLTLLSFPSHLLCLNYCVLYFPVCLFVDLHPLESKVLVPCWQGWQLSVASSIAASLAGQALRQGCWMLVHREHIKEALKTWDPENNISVDMAVLLFFIF